MIEIRKNAFGYLVLAMGVAVIALIFCFGIPKFGEGFPYPYLAQGALLLGLAMALVVLCMALGLFARVRPERLLSEDKKAGRAVEACIVAVVLLVGAYLRLWIIWNVPMEMESDFLYYHDIAVAMVDGSFRTMDLMYMALSPNGYGYPYVLSKVYVIFGSGERVGLYLCLVSSMLTALFVYRIGRRTMGRLCGLCALMIAAFWPSQILYSDFNGTEALSTCVLYGAALLFVWLLRPIEEHTRFFASWGRILMHAVVGVLLALGAAVRPVSTVFLIAALISVLFIRVRIKYGQLFDVPLGTRFLSRGWTRAVVMLVGYMAMSSLVNIHISNAIGIDIGSNSVTMGYSLYTGMNLTSRGGYSEEVSRLLTETYERTGSVEEAGKACREAALRSIRENPVATLNMMIDKFDVLWANDDYGASSNIHSLSAQGKLTKEWDEFFVGWRKVGNVYYFAALMMSCVCLVFLWRSRVNAMFVFALFFLGAVALHMLVEVQNRYHYYVLQTLALLSGGAVSYLYQACRARLVEKDERARIEGMVDDALKNLLMYPSDKPDMEINYFERAQLFRAVAEGHVRVTVTEAYSRGEEADKELANVASVPGNEGEEPDESKNST